MADRDENAALRQHPDGQGARLARQRDLAPAWRVDHRDRVGAIVDACRDRRVLHLGCVDHTADMMRSPGWLHRHILEVATSVVGADHDRAGIEAMRAAGMEAFVADVTEDPSEELLTAGPFDLVVAGELIEHLSAPQALLRFVRPLLAPGGSLLLSTPNPYAMWRVRRGQLRVIWENTDHVTYLFPAGLAEMANREQMLLREAATVGRQGVRSVLVRSIRGPMELWLSKVFRSEPPDYEWLNPLEAILFARRERYGWLGETAIYRLEVDSDPRSKRLQQ